MRLRWSSVRRLMAPATTIVSRCRQMMGAPLRRPRMTTRLLMLVVAIVAVGIWAAMNVPQAIELAIAYQEKAEIHARSEQRSLDSERASLARARAIRSELDQWRLDTGSSDQLTEHYFASRRESEIIDATYQREMATYYANLKSKYRWATWLPLTSIPPDPTRPPDPLSRPPLHPEPGKSYDSISEGGISVAFSPNGTSLAVGCSDNTIRLLELPSRKLLAQFSGAIRNPCLQRLLTRRNDALLGRKRPSRVAMGSGDRSRGASISLDRTIARPARRLE